jgi:hypothetical protein
MLNTSKGPAVRALRAQADKLAYGRAMREAVEGQAGLTLREGMVEGLLVEHKGNRSPPPPPRRGEGEHPPSPRRGGGGGEKSPGPDRHQRLLSTAIRLHAYLAEHHWDGRVLVGPDPGVRLNWRLGRFAKSYLAGLPWRDDLVYLQAQGYWILGNWQLHGLTGDERYRRLALECADGVLARQRPDGCWEYPNPEWRGKIATVEGDWAAIGLLETHRRSGSAEALGGARSWHRFLQDRVGFQHGDGWTAINYFADDRQLLVPNNSVLTLRTLAELARATGDDAVLGPCGGMLAFLANVQEASGELPYRLGARERRHFLCYQYNAFQLLDLQRYHWTTGDEAALPILQGLARFLAGGVGSDGAAACACGSAEPEVVYYAAALAAALGAADALGLGPYRSAAERAYDWVLSHQRPDGGFAFFSRRNYRILADRRSYPRYLAMILHHLLLGAELASPGPPVELASAVASQPKPPAGSPERFPICAS